MNPITNTQKPVPVTMMDGRFSRRNLLVLAAAAAAAASCSTNADGTANSPEGSGSGGPQSGPRILRFHDRTVAPDTLDPARGLGVPLGYDQLIYEAPDGSFEPQIAESWTYVGEGNTTFEIKLRPNITFADGQPVNSEAVKANIEYRLDPAAASESAAALAAVSEVELVDDLTVRVHLSVPDPLLHELFAQHQGGPGMLISPAALADPSVLATSTYGVGRYKLDPAETVMGDHYTWVPDPNYWDPDSVYWDKIVIHHMPELSAALAAMQSGQIDLMRADSTIVDAGEAAGYAVVGPGYPIVLGINLADRDGLTAPALGDQRVRQALSHAIDREKIAEALFGTSGMPADQMSAPTRSGWHDEPFYPYDQDRARELLADAGYADGFSFRVRLPEDEMFVRLVQAIADELQQVGVDMQSDVVPALQFNQADDAVNREYGAIILGWGVNAPFRMARSFWLPTATNNVFDSADDVLIDLDEQLAVAGAEQQEDLNRQIIARVAELGWFLPIVIFGESIIYNDQVVEIPWTDYQSFPFAIEYRPAEA